uniref:Uncharacterized protein n=1 Tax=Rhizophagus irregularis (strain DAOM 181602 / DAOM 197198 / MUCL 43194) TaxID=747089 RepID=U9SZ41_RHIID
MRQRKADRSRDKNISLKTNRPSRSLRSERIGRVLLQSFTIYIVEIQKYVVGHATLLQTRKRRIITQILQKGYQKKDTRKLHLSKKLDSNRRVGQKVFSDRSGLQLE